MGLTRSNESPGRTAVMSLLLAVFVTALMVADVFDPGLEGSIVEGMPMEPGVALVAAVVGAGIGLCFVYVVGPFLLSRINGTLETLLLVAAVIALVAYAPDLPYEPGVLGFIWAVTAARVLSAFRPEYAPNPPADSTG